MTDSHSIPISQAILILKSQQIWREAVCMKFHLEVSDLTGLLEDFALHCVTISEDYKPLREYKRHFINWLYTQKRYENNQQPSVNNRTASKEQRDAEFTSYVADILKGSGDDCPLW